MVMNTFAGELNSRSNSIGVRVEHCERCEEGRAGRVDPRLIPPSPAALRGRPLHALIASDETARRVYGHLGHRSRQQPQPHFLKTTTQTPPCTSAKWQMPRASSRPKYERHEDGRKPCTPAPVNATAARRGLAAAEPLRRHLPDGPPERLAPLTIAGPATTSSSLVRSGVAENRHRLRVAAPLR